MALLLGPSVPGMWRLSGGDRQVVSIYIYIYSRVELPVEVCGAHVPVCVDVVMVDLIAYRSWGLVEIERKKAVWPERFRP